MIANRRSIWRLAGLLALTVLIVVAFVLLVDVEQVLRTAAAADRGLLVAASAALLSGMWFYALRWRLLLDDRPTRAHTFHACNIAHAGNILIPLRAGEALRILVIGQADEVSLTTATSSFVVERLFEQLLRVMALVTAVAIGAGLELSPASVGGGLAAVGLAFGLIVGLVRYRTAVLNHGPRWLAKLPRVTAEGAHGTLADLLNTLGTAARPRQFALVFFWSVVTWSFFGAFFYLTLRALGTAIDPADQLAVALGALALSPPSAPTQPGIFQASIVAPLAAVGYDAEPLTAFAILLQILEIVWMGGFAFVGIVALRVSPRSLAASLRA